MPGGQDLGDRLPEQGDGQGRVGRTSPTGPQAPCPGSAPVVSPASRAPSLSPSPSPRRARAAGASGDVPGGHPAGRGPSGCSPAL